jgi:hypothetical protein
MATLIEVQDALEDGDKRSAIRILKVLLQEKPSAEAWYMAAQITRDEDKAITYLNRALVANPTHRNSLEMLNRLGVSQKHFSTMLREETFGFLSAQSQRSPLLRWMRPEFRFLAVGMLLAVVVYAFIFVFSAVRTATQGPVIAEVAPVAQSVDYVVVNDILARFGSSDLEYVVLDVLDNTRVAQSRSIRLTVKDASNVWHNVTVQVYNSITALINDRHNLNEQSEFANVVSDANAVMVYPIALTGEDATRLIEVFRATISS